jgi:hypothetical protein
LYRQVVAGEGTGAKFNARLWTIAFSAAFEGVEELPNLGYAFDTVIGACARPYMREALAATTANEETALVEALRRKEGRLFEFKIKVSYLCL